MTNDISGVNLEEVVPCIALSKNDLYVLSACGGKVSLFNMMTFKFHSDQLRLLVIHETQLAIYDASKMERIRQWVPQDVLQIFSIYFRQFRRTPVSSGGSPEIPGKGTVRRT
ncbi:Topless-related protein [Vigna angularis]|uniref:Topless-related protein n=1 Tax=Phaseolus angularis TaxID=3914 RepID=A0A8T0JKL5_PHAAN|nr:Topless-related protein [Vigna angularis]